MNVMPINNTNISNNNPNSINDSSDSDSYYETDSLFDSDNNDSVIDICEEGINNRNNNISNNHLFNVQNNSIVDFSNVYVQKLYNDFLMEINDTYNNSDSCIICLDVFDKNNIMFDNINNITIKKDCSCNYYVHITCLNEWLKDNEKCLICPKSIDTLYNVLSKNVENEINDELLEDMSLTELCLNRTKLFFIFCFYVFLVFLFLYIIMYI